MVDSELRGGAVASDARLFAEATAAWERGEGESVLPKIERALAGSRNYRLWHIHGLILRELERRGEALKSLTKAVELASNASNPAHAMAQTLLEAGLPSVGAYARALHLSPGNRELLLGLAAALTAEGRVEEAITGLERSVALVPQWVQAHTQLAKLRWMQGEREDFARSFDEALATLPGNLELRREQIITLTHAEHWDDALRAIANGRAVIGDHTMFDSNEAVVHSEAGRIAAADAIFDRLADLADTTVQIRRVRHFLRSGRANKAIAAIQPWLGGEHGFLFWPYASIAWRLTADPRSSWLEGDPRFVGVYDIAERLPPLTELAPVLRQLHTVRGEPLEQSLRGGTQTDGNLFHRIDPVIVQVRETIRQAVADYVAKLPIADESHPLLGAKRRPIRFSGAWSVRLKNGGYHANHVHPLGWISSALYITLPPDAGEEGAGVLTLGEPQAQLGLDLPPTRLVEPRPGRLVLFPSWMWHGTRPFGSGERMTIAFDVARPG